MSAPENTQLTQRDDALIGLGALLEPERLLESLRSHLPEHDLRDPRTTYLRYKPRTSCIAAISITLDGQALGLYAKALASCTKLAKLERQIRGPSALGPGVIVLYDLGVAVCAFPKDRKLEALTPLGDAGARPYLMAELFPEEPEFWGVTLEPLRYKPERRFVGRLQGEHHDAAIKAYLTSDFVRVHRNARAFELQTLRTPKVLARSSEHAIVVHEWLPGRALERPNTNQLERLGAGLAELHAQRPEGLETRSAWQEANAARELAAWLSELHPRLGRPAQAIAEHLAHAWTHDPPAARPTHGDFYQEQVLEGPDGLCLIDFDEAAWNDPAADLGNLLGHLERDHLLCDGVRAQSEALLTGYRDAGGITTDARVRLASALGLFKLAPSPFRFGRSDWYEQIEAILDRCQGLLAPTRPHRAPVTGALEESRA